MLTGCPSTTPFGLALGPTNPERINLSQETSDFRRPRFSLGLSLLMPAGSLPNRPSVLSLRLQTVQNALLPNHRPKPMEFTASVRRLSPVELSVPDHLTSELLRFL